MPTPRPIARAAALAAPTGFDDIELRSPLTFAEEGDALLFGTPAQRGIERIVHFAKRTDARIGSGSLEDPFHAPDAETIDFRLRPLFTAAVENVNVLFGHGTFDTFGGGDALEGVTYGNYGWAMNHGWRVMGAGRRATTLRLVKKAGYTAPQAVVRPFGGAAAIEVRDLTIDCSWPTIDTTGVTYGICGISGRVGDDFCIERVHVTNSGAIYGDGGGAIYIFVITQASSGGIIRGCRIDGCNNYTHGIGALCNNEGGGPPDGDWNGEFGVSSLQIRVEDNVIIGPGASATNSIGLGVSQASNYILRGNLVRGFDVGNLMDTGFGRYGVIEANKFDNCHYPIQWSGGYVDPATGIPLMSRHDIRFNSIGVRQDGRGIYLDLNCAENRIFGNRIDYMEGATRTGGLGITIVNGSNTLRNQVFDNTIASDLTSSVHAATVIRADHNLTFAGAAVAGIPVV